MGGGHEILRNFNEFVAKQKNFRPNITNANFIYFCWFKVLTSLSDVRKNLLNRILLLFQKMNWISRTDLLADLLQTIAQNLNTIEQS